MIEIIDKTPSMADVVSGAVIRPREPFDGEPLNEWLLNDTPAGVDISGVPEPLDRIPQRFERLGLTYAFRRGRDLIAVNNDGTRYAIEYDSPVIAIVDLLGEMQKAIAEQGITQSELANRTGLTQPNISAMLAGKFTPRADMLERLANAVGLKLKLVKR